MNDMNLSAAFTAKPAPSALAMVPFVSVQDMMRLVNDAGIETVLTDLAGYIEARLPPLARVRQDAARGRAIRATA